MPDPPRAFAKNATFRVVFFAEQHRIVLVRSVRGKDPTPLPELLIRMREQDRGAVAEFIEAYGTLIRRRVRSKLSPTMRRVFDSLDVLSSLARRLDVVVAKGQLRAMTEGQFFSFVNQVAENAIVDQARLVRRLQRVEAPDGEVAHLMRRRLLDGDEAPSIREDELARVIGSVPTEADRDMVFLWMNGRSLKSIGETLGLTHAAARQRWRTLRVSLKAILEEDVR